MTTSANKGFVKLLLRRAKHEWRDGKTPQETLKPLASMIRNQMIADATNQDHDTSSKGSNQARPKNIKPDR